MIEEEKKSKRERKYLFREELRANRRKGIFLCPCAFAGIIVILIVSHYVYTNTANKYSRQQANESITETSSLLADSISTHVRSWYAELNIAQQFVAAYDKEMANYTQADDLLARLQDARFLEFDKVCLITENGMLLFSSDECYDASGEAYMQAFLSGCDENGTYADFLDLEALADQMVFAIPYTADEDTYVGSEEIVGIAATISAEQISEIIGTDVFGDNYAYVVITDDEGNVVVDTTAKKPIENNMFDTFEQFADGDVLRTLQDDFDAGNTKTLNMMGVTRQFLTYYAPIWSASGDYGSDDLNDYDIGRWRLVVMTDADIVTQNISGLFDMSKLLLYVVLILFFIALLVLIFVSMHMTNKKLVLTCTDPMTGVLNDTRFLHDGQLLLARSIQQHEKDGASKKYAVVSYNIYQFKLVNYQIGHEKADQVLEMIGPAIQEFLLPDEIVAHSYADRFTVLLRMDTEDGEDRLHLLEDKLLALPYPNQTQLKFTIGVYMVREDDDDDISVAMDRARFAQSETRKEQGQSTNLNLVVYSQEMFDKQAQENRLIKRAQHALKERHFVVYYQLKRNIQQKEWCGCEALVRWKDPDLGFLSPGLFIPLFERNGFVTKLDEYVFENVCADLRTSLDANEPVVPVSVNVSKCHLRDMSFLDRYKELIARYRVPYHLLEFEVTEGLAVENAENLKTLIKELHALGCKCSLDDFGSGYSSFNMIQEFNFDTIKLDRRFFYGVEGFNQDSRTIVESLIDLSHKLGKSVISEGIEKEDQVVFLRDKNCDAIQGYYFSKPAPIEACRDLLKHN